MLLDRYIQKGKSLVLLTPDNINSYIGKIVNLRSPMYCKDNHICNKCAGELYYKMGIDNVGLISNVIGTSMTTLEKIMKRNSLILVTVWENLMNCL